MAQPKVYEFAKEIGVETITLMDKLRKWEIPVKSHMAALSDENLAMIKEKMAEEEGDAPVKKKKVVKKKAAAKKKTVAKKASAKSKIVRKKSDIEEEEAPAKKARKKVIRRKAGATPATTPIVEKKKKTKSTAEEEVVFEEQTTEVLEASSEVSAIADVQEAVVEAVSDTVVAEEAPEVKAEAKPVAKETAAPKKKAEKASPTDEKAKKQEMRKRKILGRMDLSTVKPKPTQKREAGERPQRSSAPRSNNNMSEQAGSKPDSSGPASRFKAVDMSTKSDSRRVDPKKKKAGKGGEDPAKIGSEDLHFNRTEFRKREILFQPKKKKQDLGREAMATKITQAAAHKRVVKVHNTISVAALAKELKVKPGKLIGFLMKQGMMLRQSDEMDFETVSLIVPEFGFEAENTFKSVDELVEQSAHGDLDADLVQRAPVVTVMGHVDHGKTSLLDAIRKTNVTAGEAGGITQHIGAYRVQLDGGRPITFLDTPGHAAFTEMRARGAQVTDIAVIVVAADDGLMPQTAEAINHAKSAGVPIIVAVNKMDRPNANPDKIKQQLTEFELIPEEWGGSTMFIPTVAIEGQGITEILEAIELQAEMLELKSNPKRSATGVVIESRLEKGRGIVATVLIQDGTLNKSEYLVAGTAYGRVRAMLNDRGKPMSEAGPGIPVEVLGLNTAPKAGDLVTACKKERQAVEIAEQRMDAERAEANKSPNSKMSLAELFAGVQTGEQKELNVVLKADVHGSVEAIKGLFDKESTEKVKIKVIHSGVGGVTESDVLLASTAGAMIVGFNVGAEGSANALAKKENISIERYSIIYELADQIKKAMKGLLDPDIVEEVIGQVEVRDLFKVPSIGTIAGCYVTDGKVTHTSLVRLLRDGKVVYDGKIASLRRFKDMAKEVAQGYECGIGIENFNDIKVGDVMEIYIKKEVEAEL